MLRGCTEFTFSLNSLAKELEKVTNSSGQVVITHCLPTLGVALRTQFDDYNLQVLRTNELIQQVFSESNFELIGSWEIFPHDREFAYKHFESKLWIFYVWYLIKFLIRKKITSLEFYALEVRNQMLVFQKSI